MITDAQKLEAWKDRMCQKCRCGAKKPQGQPFCVACWEKLPGPLQHALLEHLTTNFNDRYFEALQFLLGDPKSLKDCQSGGLLPFASASRDLPLPNFMGIAGDQSQESKKG